MSKRRRQAPRPLSVYQQIGLTKRQKRQISREYRRYKKSFYEFGGSEEMIASKLEVGTRIRTSEGELTPKTLGIWDATGYSPAQLENILDQYNEEHHTDLTLKELVMGGYAAEKKELAKRLNEQLKRAGKDSYARAAIISQQIYGSE